MASDKSGFFGELKRRHVWRVAAAYAVAAWLLVQVATQVFPFFDIPNWTVRLVVVLIVIGFPAAVILAWVYEITPEGIRRTEPADSPEARAEVTQRSVGRKLNAIIMAALVLAVAVLGWRLLAMQRTVAPSRALDADVRPAAAPAPAPTPTVTAVARKSVAVLPFVDESATRDQQYFSDGLSEALINALSQFAGLKVISRNSAFQFRDSKEDANAIGRKLGVAHLLEGSVQRAGDDVRITATLVKASDGSILWSQHYDRSYRDLFALQDAITEAVAGALRAKLQVAPGAVVQSDRPPSGNLEAYTAFQHGKAYFELGSEAGFRRAIESFDLAIRLDPRYALAYAQVSIALNGLAGQYLGAAAAARENARARAAVDTALKLDPDSSAVHRARGILLLDVDMDWSGAEAEARRALELAPNDSAAQFFLGNMLATTGRIGSALELTQRALASDPRHANWYNWLSLYLTGAGRLDDARDANGTAIALQPGAAAFHVQRGIIEILRGNTGAALAAARQEPPGVWRDVAQTLALQAGRDRPAADAALDAFIANHADSYAYQIAQMYALRQDPDDVFKWLDRAWAVRDSGVGYMLFDPLVLRYRDDPRFAAFCKRVGLPTTTDALAMK